MAKSSATFSTIGGNTVTWTLDTAEPQKGHGRWTCGGCGTSREWDEPAGANSHAAACRAN